MDVNELMDYLARFKENALEYRYSCAKCGKKKRCTWRMAVCDQCSRRMADETKR